MPSLFYDFFSLFRRPTPQSFSAFEKITLRARARRAKGSAEAKQKISGQTQQKEKLWETADKKLSSSVQISTKKPFAPPLTGLYTATLRERERERESKREIGGGNNRGRRGGSARIVGAMGGKLYWKFYPL